MRVACAALLVLLLTSPAAADIRDLVGRPIVDVHVEVGGVVSVDPSVLQLVETRIGEPLSMERVRESIDHLVGLGRFEDIRIFAELAPGSNGGVVVRWRLVPVQRIDRLELEGRTVFSDAALRAAVSDRTGTRPVSTRSVEIVDLLESYYAERGYRQAQIAPRLVPGDTPELVTLHLAIVPGARTVVGAVTVTGDASDPPATVIRRLDLERGTPFSPTRLDERVTAYETQLRELGHYEARVGVTPTFADDAASVDLVVHVERGPRVRVVFAGDPLPEGRRDTLVPIRQERSVDLDLLEDASRNIENFLRQQGYRSAETSYVREEKQGEMVLTFTVTRGPLHRLASLEVTGASAVPMSEITPLLALKPGEPLSDVRVGTVAAAVAELYRVKGFARAAIKPEEVIVESNGASQERSVAVRLIVNEGPQTVMGDVTIAGAANIDETRLRALLGLSAGRPFYRPQLDADRDALERLYRNEGFQAVRIEPQTAARDDGRQLDLQWRITEGPQVLVDRVLISGNTRTDPELIRREIVLKSGSPLGEDAIIESQRRLATLGLFRRVRIIELPHGASVTRDILIEVEEAPATTIAYGGGVEAGRRLRVGEQAQAEERIDVAPRGFFEVSRRNLWGKNRSASFFTRVSLRPRDPVDNLEAPPELPVVTGGYGFNEYRVVGTFREPRPFDAAGDLQLTAYFEQALRSSFNFRRRGVRVEYGRRFPNSFGISGRWALERTRLFDTRILPEDEVIIDRLFPQVRLSTLTASLLRDTRNDPVDAATGTLVGTDLSFALPTLGSQVGFVKSFSQAFIYRRLPGRSAFTFVTGARFGMATLTSTELDDDTTFPDLPASERFFAGGDSTVRGFVLDRLGRPDTLNRFGFPIGGNGLVVLNAELRTPYWKGISTVGFFDTGNVFRRASDISLADIRPAAGFGIRYRSPIGPLRVDLGFNLDPQILPTGDRERRAVFHLSLGQAF